MIGNSSMEIKHFQIDLGAVSLRFKSNRAVIIKKIKYFKQKIPTPFVVNPHILKP